MKPQHRTLALKLGTVLLAIIFLMPIASAWQYGESTSPTTPTYNAYEMPTDGLYDWTHWDNTTGAGGNPYFFTSASNTGSGGGFSQVGFTINNVTSTAECAGDDITSNSTQNCLDSKEWGIFYEWCFSCGPSGTYYGNNWWKTPPSGVSPTDEWYFSGATYLDNYEYSWMAKDSTAGKTYTAWVCSLSMTGLFAGGVGGISESGASGGYGPSGSGPYVNEIALWAEIISNNTRNSGTPAVPSIANSPPTSDHITVNSANNVNVGWTSSGTHPTSGSLWTGPYHATDENVPSDESCS